MSLEHFHIRNIRNLAEIQMAPAAGINLIVGPNGSGKTSLLEAIYILGRGRSFRESRSGAVIRRGEEWYEVAGRLRASEQGRQTQIGIRRSGKEILVKMNGIKVRKLSVLARELPIHVITPRSHELLEAGSGVRRRFVEWGVFHVEHPYQDLSIRYQRVLAQRNAALKGEGEVHAYWDRELIDLSESLDAYRRRYVEELSDYLKDEMRTLLADMEIDLEWRRGWSGERSLEQVLQEMKLSDIKRGYTQAGAHRADLVVRVEGEHSRHWASRGQQKLIICGLFLAQSRLIADRTGRQPLILVDDLAAELDDEHRQRMLERLSTSRSQVFLTTTHSGAFGRDFRPEAMFHVEHGAITAESV